MQTQTQALLQQFETDRTELSLSEKLILANHPEVQAHVRDELQKQQSELDVFNSVDGWEQQLNIYAKEEAKKLFLSGMKFYIFWHPSDTREWRCRSGIVIEMHYFGQVEDFTTGTKWWNGLRKLLQGLHRLRMQDQTALAPRSTLLKWRVEHNPKWKLIAIDGEYEVVKMLPRKSIHESINITVTYTDAATQQSVQVSGPEKERKMLEQQAYIMLSRKVYAYRRLHHE